MKKLINIFVLIFLGIVLKTNAQYTISNHPTAEEIANQLQGEGIQILNPTIVCRDSFLGTYDGIGLLGIDTGIVLALNHTDRIFTEYDTANIPRWYHDSYSSSYSSSSYIDTSYLIPFLNTQWCISTERDGIPDYYELRSRRSCAIAFDFIPAFDTFSMNFVFTDALFYKDNIEYPLLHVGGNKKHYPPFHNWAYIDGLLSAPRCDMIAILLTGNEYADTVNLAVYENERNIPVNHYSLMVDSLFHQNYLDDVVAFASILELQEGDTTMWWPPLQNNRSGYLRDNTNGELMSYFNYPALTRPIYTGASLTACDTYHLAISIFDIYYKSASVSIVDLTEFVGSALFIDKLSSTNHEGGQEGSCMDTATSIQNSYQNEDICIAYPNPFVDEIALELKDKNNSSQIYKVSISDAMGKEIYHQSSRLAPINKDLRKLSKKLSPGLYIISIEDVQNNKRQVLKVNKL